VRRERPANGTAERLPPLITFSAIWRRWWKTITAAPVRLEALAGTGAPYADDLLLRGRKMLGLVRSALSTLKPISRPKLELENIAAVALLLGLIAATGRYWFGLW
jgi:hypothetical protein